jgi:DNA-binding NtrC family response regulator
MELLETIRTRFPDVVPVVITGYATIASAVETMKLGAFDYLPKPFTPDEMTAVAKKAWEKRQSIMETRAIAQGDMLPSFCGIVGKSPKIQEIFRMIRKVAPTTSTVLIVGETGTGKELVARAIHTSSPRSEHRFCAVDCGTLSVELLESELFGHVKGAFTGAVTNKQGIFEAADQGTVFLDEICNINLEIQGKLLRFIQEREFKRILVAIRHEQAGAAIAYHVGHAARRAGHDGHARRFGFEERHAESMRSTSLCPRSSDWKTNISPTAYSCSRSSARSGCRKW